MAGVLTAVSASATHSFGKDGKDSIRLITGIGVAGDAHGGSTVQHRSRVARDPSQPNLRQGHLIHAELHDELRTAGIGVVAGGSARRGAETLTTGNEMPKPGRACSPPHYASPPGERRAAGRSDGGRGVRR
jgi:hypothetical protein